MSILEWDDSIAVHIPAIDSQHKELIQLINTLHEAVQKKEGASLLEATLRKLINYVIEHFTFEEQLMLSYNFPGFSSHRQEHDYFVQKLAELQSGFQDSEEASRNLLDFMVDWIICHIKGTDQTYGRFILARMEETAA